MKTLKYKRVKINVLQIDGFELGTENVWEVTCIFLKSMKVPQITITVTGGLESQAMRYGQLQVDDILG